MLVFGAAWNNEDSMAVDCQITRRLGSCHRALHQQLGLLHAADLPAYLPQEHSSLRHEKRKFAVGFPRIFESP